VRATSSLHPGNKVDSANETPPTRGLATVGRSQTIFGIFTKKERWGLSKSGWLLSTSIVLLIGYLLLRNIYPFLAVTHRVNTKTLIMEGWVHRYAIRTAAEEFKNGMYDCIVTTGGPVEGNGGYVNDFQTSASVGAEALKKVGIPDDSVEMVPSHVIGRDRTYSSAVALRRWFHDQGRTVSSLNVLTEDCHGRRTQLLYQKALGKGVSVGVISVKNPDYDPRYWWKTSDGVREVIGESLAYVYARFLFVPQPSQNQR
jgi:DUF218 domain